jgi:CheY-like chemotaxis protein
MNRTILLADDSVTIQKVVELTFMEEEVEVVAVSSGAEALEKLSDLHPDLVIADVHMPGPDGFEICRKVKQEHPEVPVLLLVGTFEPFNVEDVQACGANGYLKKPFDSQELMRQVEELLPATPRAAQAGSAEASEKPAPGDRFSWMASVDAEIDAVGGVDESSGARKAVEAPAHPVAVEAPAHPVAVEAAVERDSPPAAAAQSVPANGGAPGPLSDDDVERIARRVVELLGSDAVREIAWEVIPDLAEVVIKDRLRQLEQQAD